MKGGPRAVESRIANKGVQITSVLTICTHHLLPKDNGTELSQADAAMAKGVADMEPSLGDLNPHWRPCSRLTGHLPRLDRGAHVASSSSEV